MAGVQITTLLMLLLLHLLHLSHQRGIHRRIVGRRRDNSAMKDLHCCHVLERNAHRMASETLQHKDREVGWGVKERVSQSVIAMTG